MAHAPETAHHEPAHGHGGHGGHGGDNGEHVSVGHDYTTTGLNHRKMLMWVFLGSDCLFFGSLIATYMVYRGQSLTGPYPIDIIDIPVTTISTFVLLCSSFAMVRALAATHENNQTGIKIWLLATAILGAIFIGFQVYEFNLFKNEGLTLGQNLFGATFFTLTGFHGAHVTLGIIWLLSLFVISFKGRLHPGTRPRRGNLRPVLALRRHRLDRHLHPALLGRRVRRRPGTLTGGREAPAREY